MQLTASMRADLSQTCKPYKSNSHINLAIMQNCNVYMVKMMPCYKKQMLNTNTGDYGNCLAVQTSFPVNKTLSELDLFAERGCNYST